MDGSDSTKSPEVSNAETIKKLKSILLKEKKLGKENNKTIQELKDIIDKKNIENQKLIEQISRLSANINIENDNLAYKLQHDELKQSTNQSLSECTKLISDILDNPKYEISFALSKSENSSDNFDNIIRFIEETSKIYESNSILKDGFDILTNKNNDLEENILSQTSQIRRLEEIIEESRNISRELENERDQLQNDLVDLRQRSEEKESYLGDECREIRREYDNFKEDSQNNINKLRLEISSLQESLRNIDNNSQILPDTELSHNQNLQEDKSLKHQLDCYRTIIDDIKEKLFVNNDCDEIAITNKILEMHEKSDSMCKSYESLKGELTEVLSKLRSINDINNLNDFVEDYKLLVVLKNTLKEKLLVATEDYEDIIKNIQTLSDDNLNLMNLFSSLHLEHIDDEKIYQIRSKIEIFDELTQIFDRNNLNIYSKQFDTLFSNDCKNTEDVSIKSDQLLDGDNNDIANNVSRQLLLDIRTELSINDDRNDSEIISQLLENHVQLKSDLDNLHMTSDYLMNKINDMLVRIGDIENHEHVSEESFKSLLDKYTNLQKVSETERERFVTEQEMVHKQLEIAQKSMSKNDLMNLEMAEIDKSLHNLHEQLKEKTSKISQLQSDYNQSVDKIKKLESNNSYLETRNAKMKQLLVKNKKELSDKLVENENIQTNFEKQQLEIETITQELENVKFDFSSMVQAKESAITKLKDQKVKFETLLKSKETKLNTILSELESKKNAFEILQTEFESYKVKAQAAFSNSQTNHTRLNFSNFQSSKESHDDTVDKKNNDLDVSVKYKSKIFELETEIDDLKLEIQSNEDRITHLTEESDMYRTDNERWNDKCKSLLKEKAELNAKFNQFYQSTRFIDQESPKQVSNRKISIEGNSIEQTVQFQSEKQKITEEFEIKLKSCKAEYRENLGRCERRMRELENLNSQLETEKWDFQEKVQLLEAKLAVQPMIPISNDLNQKIAKWPGPLLIERQQGEGMDASQIDQSDLYKVGGSNNVPISPGGHIISPRLLRNNITNKKNNTYNNGLVPLEELLSPKTNEDTDLDSSNTSSSTKKYQYQLEDYGINTSMQKIPISQIQQKSSEKELIEELEKTVNEYKSQLKIISGSLEDAESTVENLNKQTELLKSEIRRLENNEEREKTLRDKQSYEYLKNVLLKFLTFKSNKNSLHITLLERDQLIPVLSTILQLTASEKQVLHDFVKYTSSLSSTSINILDSNDNPDNSGGGGWSNYFTWSN